MFNDASSIQIFNTLINLMSIFVMLPILVSIWSYKKRAKERFDQIERELDHILLLAHEVYQSDVKEKAIILDQEPTVVRPTTEEIRAKITGRI